MLSGVCQNAPSMPLFDFSTTIEFAADATSKTIPPAYALPRASYAAVGSLHASADYQRQLVGVLVDRAVGRVT